MFFSIRLMKVIPKTFLSERKSRKTQEIDKKSELRGVERKRREKVKTAVSLLNPKTKFCFLPMSKIRELMN